MLKKNTVVRNQDIVDLEDAIDEILGTGVGHLGYGQITKRTDVTGEVVKPDALDNAIAMLNLARSHQTGVFDGFGTDIERPKTKDEINADLINQLYAARDLLEKESLDYHFTSMTVTGTVHTSNRGRTWGPRESISTEIDVVWADENRARWFFNSGGEVRISLEHPVTTTEANRSWNNTLKKVGVIRFAALKSMGTNSDGILDKSIGYYALNDYFKLLFDGTDLDSSFNYLDFKRPGYVYGFKDDVYIRVKKIAKGLRFRVELTEMNNQVNSAGTSVKFTLQYATRFLRTPPIEIPTLSTSKTF